MTDTEPKILPQPIFHEPFFNEDKPSPDPTGFETRHPSDNATYKRIESLLTKDIVEIPSSRIADDEVFGLDEAYGAHGAEVLAKVKKAVKIIFHSCGDSGASTTRKYADELRVADQVSIDCARSDANNRPAFLFHLGDVVYNFGESRYYYDQFYEPFRAYPAPIFAIPAAVLIEQMLQRSVGDDATVPEIVGADLDHRQCRRQRAARHHVLGSDLLLAIVEIKKVSGKDVDGADRKANRSFVD